MPLTFTIRKDDAGKWINTAKWVQHLADLPPDRYKTQIVPYKQRSLPQNSFYHGVVVPMVYAGLKDAGFTVRHEDDAHDIMKRLFLTVREEKNGLAVERVRSTTELSTTEFIEYIQMIQVWAMDYLNVSIPNPGEQTEIDYHVSIAQYEQELNATIIQ